MTIQSKQNSLIFHYCSESGNPVYADKDLLTLCSDDDKQLKRFDLLEAINANALLFFLLANLLTGAVNVTTVTMLASTPLALTELTVYMLTLSLTVSVLHVHRIRVKFW